MKSFAQLIGLLLIANAIAVNMESMDDGMGKDGMVGMMMMMPMYFWTGNDVTFLFKNVESKSDGGYTWGLIVTFLLGFAIEFISYLRKYVHMKAQLESIN